MNKLAQITDLVVQANLLADKLDAFEKSGRLNKESELRRVKFDYCQNNLEKLIDLLTNMAGDLL